MEFDPLKEDLTNCSVELLIHLSNKLKLVEGKHESFAYIGKNGKKNSHFIKSNSLLVLPVGANIDDQFSNYYKKSFFDNRDISFIDSILPEFDLFDYKAAGVGESFAKLLQVTIMTPEFSKFIE